MKVRKNIAALFLIPVFILASTPKIWWHYVFSQHKDVAKKCEHAQNGCYHADGHNCLKGDFYILQDVFSLNNQAPLKIKLLAYTFCLLTTNNKPNQPNFILENKGPPAGLN